MNGVVNIRRTLQLTSEEKFGLYVGGLVEIRYRGMKPLVNDNE